MWLNPLSRKPAFSVEVVPSIRIHSIGLCGFWDASAWGQPECLKISKPPTDLGCFALHKLSSNGGSVNQHTRENAGRLKLMKVKMHQLLQCISCRRNHLVDVFIENAMNNPKWTRNLRLKKHAFRWRALWMSRKRNRPCLSVIGGGGHLRNGLPEHYGQMVFPRQPFLK